MTQKKSQKLILIINSGSTSLKYKVFLVSNLKEKTAGYLSGIGQAKIRDHAQAFRAMLRELLGAKIKLEEIVCVGHRVVHGGIKFFLPTKITAEVLKQLEEFSELAPLHNPANLLGIRSAIDLFPRVPNYACFDTAFYRHLPVEAYTYPLPWKILKETKIRKYGFHGLSHEYLLEETAKKLKKEIRKVKLISLHLGGGASITAVENGRAVETSMGFTPCEGLMMMTRSGDLDPALLPYLEKKLNLTPNKLNHLLNFESGIKGIAGLEDMLELYQKAKAKDERASLALEMYVHRIRKYLGAYLALLGRVDAVVFSGQIGSGKKLIRDKILHNLAPILGEAKIFNIKTNEELMIARLIKAINNYN